MPVVRRDGHAGHVDGERVRVAGKGDSERGDVPVRGVDPLEARGVEEDLAAVSRGREAYGAIGDQAGGGIVAPLESIGVR